MSYANTLNKESVRTLFDRPILERWRAEVGLPLTYLGLPGPEIRDFREWGDLLSADRSAVESLGRGTAGHENAKDTIRRLLATAMAFGISEGLQMLEGDIEDIIINAADRNQQSPKINDLLPPEQMHFAYDVINLDFEGGLGYRDSKGRTKRVQALKRLFYRQEGHDFLLLLTLNVRHGLGSSIVQFVRDLSERHHGTDLQPVLDWYLDRKSQGYMLKIVVPSLLRSAAELSGFTAQCYPPITYVGHERARMMHFAFEFRFCPESIKAFGHQDDRKLIELPFLQCEHGTFSFAEQHPGVRLTDYEANLTFLPDQARRSLIAIEHADEPNSTRCTSCGRRSSAPDIEG